MKMILSLLIIFLVSCNILNDEFLGETRLSTHIANDTSSVTGMELNIFEFGPEDSILVHVSEPYKYGTGEQDMPPGEAIIIILRTESGDFEELSMTDKGRVVGKHLCRQKWKHPQQVFLDVIAQQSLFARLVRIAGSRSIDDDLI